MKAKVLVVCCLTLLQILWANQSEGKKNVKQKFGIDQLLPKETKGAVGLEELLQRAKGNYQLIAKGDAVAKSEAEKMAAYLEFGPTLSASYGYQYQTNPSVSGNYYGGNSASLTANWELYSGFSTINKVKQQSALHRASIAEKQYSEQNLYLQIIQQYYAYFTNYSNLVSLQQKKKLLQSNVERLQRLYSSGLTTVDDLESLKAEASLTDYQIAQKELELEQNRLNLSLLTNSRVVQLKRNHLKFPNIKVKQERADITALKEQAESIGYQKKQLSYAPKISLYNTFTYNDKFGDDYLRPEHKIQNVVGVSVSMTLDSFSLYKQREAIGLSQMQALKELNYKKEEQKKDIALYKKSLDIAKIKVKSAEAGLRSALLTFENVSKRYDAQLVNYVDYLNALSQKFNAEATYVESLNDYELQKANFVFYSGQDLEKYIER
ncbi:TolC family protein [Helicobacter kayseriensis]|uniref:TolC family protein n=1 Tax=Helicobacter kayseriensis TaxID=2905877 RepID=UPI001E485401|nr:TolC family protein [Helicobacter kayseriensis]MCE3047484.1 TolC family protein [Helicobacter kayseriensis]MCE3048783.1 TolC family protein [Helicobacter kayseriensis]